MKIAIVGKGGSGKTTTAAVMARTFAGHGHDTLALDCDSNPNLGISLGLGAAATERLIAVRAAVEARALAHPATAEELVERFGVDAPDGVRLAVVTAIENPEPGCPCCGINAESLLAELAGGARIVIADFEAGLDSVLRLRDRPVDAVVVVVEPTARSLEVGRRAAEAVTAGRLGRLVVTANRVRDAVDEARVRAAFPGLDPVLVPDEPGIVAAERADRAPLDVARSSPGVQALIGLADLLRALDLSPAARAQPAGPER